MAETLNDIVLNSTYKNLNAETGIASDQRIIILNKSSSPVRVQIKTLQPTSNLNSGWIIAPLESCVVYPQGTEKVWAMGNGPIYVQIYY